MHFRKVGILVLYPISDAYTSNTADPAQRTPGIAVHWKILQLAKCGH